MDNLVLLCPTHHRSVHEVGYLAVALGHGRFTFHRPDGSVIPDVGDAPCATSEQLTGATIVPH